MTSATTGRSPVDGARPHAAAGRRIMMSSESAPRNVTPGMLLRRDLGNQFWAGPPACVAVWPNGARAALDGEAAGPQSPGSSRQPAACSAQPGTIVPVRFEPDLCRMSRMSHRILVSALVVCSVVVVAPPGDVRAAKDLRTLSRQVFEDKVRGGWAGQMIGVSFGAPTEFHSNGAIIEGELPRWTPDRIQNAIDQDDLYVEMTFA